MSYIEDCVVHGFCPDHEVEFGCCACDEKEKAAAINFGRFERYGERLSGDPCCDGHDFSGEGGYSAEIGRESGSESFDCRRCGYSAEVIYF